MASARVSGPRAGSLRPAHPTPECANGPPIGYAFGARHAPPTPSLMDLSLRPDLPGLAVRQLEAKASCFAALAEFQKSKPAPTITKEVRRAAAHGFAWFARPSEPGFFEVRLCHADGAEISAEGSSITALLAGLLGHPLAQDVAVVAAAAAAEEVAGTPAASLAEEEAGTPTAPEPSTAPVQAAAESLAAATGGAVVVEVAADPGPDPATPLTDQQKAVAIGMISSLSAEQRKVFTIAFRDAFRVPREVRAIVPLIAEARHMEFCDRWSIEAAGGVAP